MQTLQTLYFQHHHELYGYVYRIIPHREEVEAIVQETFLRFHQQTSAEFSSLQQARSWLFTTAHNLTCKRLRQERRELGRIRQAEEQHSLPMNYSAGQSHEQILLDQEQERNNEQQRCQQQQRVRQALSMLSEQHATLLRLRTSGLKYEEIAAVVGVQTSSVSRLLMRAKEAFRKAYQQVCEEGQKP